eukprot:TRINITY_DN7870_c0_g1_i3.p1 TRINITY_DN7870_c0_g1~~TRINITY_DN7870_c0_g1_i3.p1  ORF type:complete len:403 (-),score=38.60 TRINITY_DN7870_c0_g1_i3:159-1367(-)
MCIRDRYMGYESRVKSQVIKTPFICLTILYLQDENRAALEERHSQMIRDQKLHPTVGSIKMGKTTFARDEHFFSHDDVPNVKRVLHDHIKEFTDPDILNLRKREWNASTRVPKNPLAEETFETRLHKIKMGLEDGPIQKLTEKKIEAGTDTRDDYTGWNVSTEQDVRQRKKDLHAHTSKIRELNKKKNERILKGTYNNPVDKQDELIQRQRLAKLNDNELRAKIREMYQFEHPGSSMEKTDAAVYRLTYEASLRKKQTDDDDVKVYSYKPDLAKTLKEGVKFEFYHSGIWEKCKFLKSKDGQEKEAWSCCLNEIQDSAGCCKRLDEKYRWNYETLQGDSHFLFNRGVRSNKTIYRVGWKLSQSPFLASDNLFNFPIHLHVHQRYMATRHVYCLCIPNLLCYP